MEISAGILNVLSMALGGDQVAKNGLYEMFCTNTQRHQYGEIYCLS